MENRVRMLQLLRTRSMCVGALARNLGISDAAVSQHLRVLRDVQLVIGERRGNFVHYRLDREAIGQWQQAVHALLDASTPPQTSPAAGGCARKEVGHECREEGLSEAGEPEG